MNKPTNKAAYTCPSDNDIVLHHLRKRQTITRLEAEHVYGVQRLSSVIHRLRAKGHNITCVNKVAPNGRQYGEYRLHLPQFTVQSERIPTVPDSHCVQALEATD